MATRVTEIIDVFSCLSSLKQRFGISFDHIVDIGAHHGNWTKKCLDVFPTSQYYLFEPIDYPELNNLAGPNIHVHNIILNEFNGEVDWYEGKNTGDSIFRERTTWCRQVAPIRRSCATLDDILHINEGNVLIKIDAQGAEIPILKASTTILQQTDFVILELPFVGNYNVGVPSFADHITYMDSIGFVVLDIVELHYIRGFLIQVDIIFISKKHSLHRAIDAAITSS